ncbi:hypothetical protein YC2023_038760 [Brassica napus]
MSCRFAGFRRKNVDSRQDTCPLIAGQSNTWTCESTSSATGFCFGLPVHRVLLSLDLFVGPLSVNRKQLNIGFICNVSGGWRDKSRLVELLSSRKCEGTGAARKRSTECKLPRKKPSALNSWGDFVLCGEHKYRSFLMEVFELFVGSTDVWVYQNFKNQFLKSRNKDRSLGSFCSPTRGGTRNVFTETRVSLSNIFLSQKQRGSSLVSFPLPRRLRNSLYRISLSLS